MDRSMSTLPIMEDAVALQAALSELEETQRALEALQAKHDALAADHSHLRYNSIDTVWRHFPIHCEEFHFLPPVDLTLRESFHNVGGYAFGQVIGEGQFSTVYKCRDLSEAPAPSAAGGGLAVKVLHKERLLSIDSALRTERELKALYKLGSLSVHPNIVQFKACIHGRRGIYIITEEVPLDLVRALQLSLPLSLSLSLSSHILFNLSYVC
jgi:serine/threonine protein kinase